MRSTNPVFRSVMHDTYASDTPVTYTNVAFKTLFLLAIIGLSAFATIYSGQVTVGLLIGALIVGFISVIVGTRSVKLSPIFSTIYALSEGVILGTVSALYAYLYDGIIPTALLTTLIVVLIMMLLYSTRIIKVTQSFASGLVIALIAVIIMAFLGFFLPFGGTFYYLIVIVSAVLSALFLLLDFRSIEYCVESGTDARYGWVLSLGLLVTIVWIYIEMLRLLAIFGRRR